MEKKTGSLAIIFLLFVLLSTWWVLSLLQSGYVQVPLPPSHMANNTYDLPSTVSIMHASSNGMESYSGVLELLPCQNLATGISASGTNPAHVKLLFTVTTLGACVSRVTTPAPFSVAVSASGSKSTVLDAVLINNAAAAFSVINAQ